MALSKQDLHDYHLECATAIPPDLDEIDRHLIAESPDHPDCRSVAEFLAKKEHCTQYGEILLKIVELLVPSKINGRSPSVIGAKVISLAWMIECGKGDLGNKTLHELADNADISRASLSYWVCHFERCLGFHARGQKPFESHESYQASAPIGWQTRRERAAARNVNDQEIKKAGEPA